MPAAFRWGETDLSKLLDASVERQLVEQLQAAECDCAAYRVAFEGAVLEMAGLLADTENDLRERQVMVAAQAIMARMQQALKRLDAAANERAQLLTAVK